MIPDLSMMKPVPTPPGSLGPLSGVSTRTIAGLACLTMSLGVSFGPPVLLVVPPQATANSRIGHTRARISRAYRDAAGGARLLGRARRIDANRPQRLIAGFAKADRVTPRIDARLDAGVEGALI